MALLEARGVEKSFGGLSVLEGVDLAVEAGTIQGLIGPNGAGKTTFFNLVSGLLRPDAGEIVVAGTDVTTRSPPAIARLGVGRTFQITRPFPSLSVRDNLLPGLLYAGGYREMAPARERAAEILDLVGIGHLAEQEGRNLTMSEQKRMEIARALATEPDLLLLDEVFAGLSHEDVERQVDLVRDVKRSEDLSILLIEHVMEATMAVCDAVAVLAAGEIIADGPPEEIVHDQRVIDVYLGSGGDDRGGAADA